MTPAFFESAAEFRRWLAKHHANTSELLVGLYKKESGRGMTYPEALDEALSFGWIDGVRKRFDEGSYTIRFTPRKPRSIWSEVNIRRAKELIALGRMKAPGLRAFELRDESRAKQYSYEREQAQFDAALHGSLRANPSAAEFFDAQPPGYRKLATFWVMSAKREETRAKRMGQLIECSEQGRRIGLVTGKE
jgi:uncharacterized protein YdeI (YjbR/CyaY-like superfamily)